MTRRLSAFLVFGASLAISACGETPAPSVSTVSVKVSACLGTGTGGGAADTCRGRIDQVASAQPGVGCLVVARASAPEKPWRLPYTWAAVDGSATLTPLGAPQIDASGDVPVVAALFLLADADESRCDTLTINTACAGRVGCVLKLTQGEAPLAGGFDFRDPTTTRCVTEIGPGFPGGEGEVERCDGLDNDCDGQVDEAFTLGEACTSGMGGCVAAGVLRCADDGTAECSAGTVEPDAAERCDKVDNDCDGAIDEGLNDCCTLGDSAVCGVDVGVCASGTQTCIADPRNPQQTVWSACKDAQGVEVRAPDLGGSEQCNGLDDDCDGSTDEGFGVGGVNLGGTCPVGVGACQRDGILVCDGPLSVRCEGTPGLPLDEICNGIDDDCNQVIDNGIVGLGECTVGVGACLATGTEQCQASDDSQVVCGVMPGLPSAEACTPEGAVAADEDCDGTTDEGDFQLGEPCQAGQAQCVLRCEASPTEMGAAVVCTPANGAPRGIEVCNGLDDDCDAQVDEGFDLDSNPLHCGGCGVACGRPNAQTGCQSGECAFNGCNQGYANADNNLENGCECQPDLIEVPDANYADENCDGVDGSANRALFVSPEGNDNTGNGTREAPFRTLFHAMSLAALNQPPRPLYLAEGTYNVTEGGAPGNTVRRGLVMASGVAIHGGYVPSEGWRRRARSDAGRTTITGSPVVLRYENLALPTLLDNVEVVALGQAIENLSSVAVVAISVAGHLTLRDTLARSGVGGGGQPGRPGRDALVADVAAINGDPGYSGGDPLSPGFGGIGGQVPAQQCGFPAVGGEADSLVVVTPTLGGDGGAGQRADNGQGTDGLSGFGLSPGSRGIGGTPAAPAGQSGGDGGIGTSGNNSQTGLVDGVIDANGGTGLWAPRGSGNAQAGFPGSSGGGGGGGGRANAGERPGGGGAGAGGGCPGEGGRYAFGGAGSFALHIMSGQVHLQHVQLVPAGGGVGGVGGAGGLGAPGGQGGQGGAGIECQGCNGGDGGDGGPGGCGGNAAGGPGGAAFAVLRVSPRDLGGAGLAQSTFRFENYNGQADPAQTELNSFSAGTAGLGGAGGDVSTREGNPNRPGVTCGGPAATGPNGRAGRVGCCRNGPGAAACGERLDECVP